MSGWLPFEQQLREILQSDLPVYDNVELKSNNLSVENSDSSSDETDHDDSEDSNEEASEDAYSDIDRPEDAFSRATPEHDKFNPFSEGNDASLRLQALNHVRGILDLAPLHDEQPHYQTPVFLGHGSADPKVSADLGQKMARLLSEDLGIDVTWKAYEGFGHWYKVPDEIDDILSFLQLKVDLPLVDARETPYS